MKVSAVVDIFQIQTVSKGIENDCIKTYRSFVIAISVPDSCTKTYIWLMFLILTYGACVNSAHVHGAHIQYHLRTACETLPPYIRSL